MNLTHLYRHHPDLALLLDDDPPHLVACHDCGLRFPPGEMLPLDLEETQFGCRPCFDWRQEVAWAEWCDRLTKEGREGA